MSNYDTIVRARRIELLIAIVRGQRVILDTDLAELYGVPTKRLNQQVQRNLSRFPPDFMFQLTEEEVNNLRLQFATSSGHGGRRYAPFVFTEHGAIMAANVLNSERAIEVSVQVVRAFIKLREVLAAHKDLALKLDELEQKYDDQFAEVFEAIRQLMEPPPKPVKPIGFKAEPGKPRNGQARKKGKAVTTSNG